MDIFNIRGCIPFNSHDKVYGMIDNIFSRLKGLRYRHFIWISVILSEVFTALMNTLMGLLLWGRIDRDLLLIGAADAFVVGLLVSAIVIVILREIRIHERRAEDALRESEAKKMEAVGLLAAGIAHDFGNILAAIKGSAYILQRRLQPGSPLLKHAEQIVSSVRRADNLTQGLLAFSRRQVMTLKALSLNDVVLKTGQLLSQLIGGHIELKLSLSDRLPAIMADAYQIEQVLMHLVNNARDAMPDGGQLIIQTDVVEMDSAFTEEHGFGLPGRYALLTVSDTGTGIAGDIMERIFEPFFTTKVVGKGTGLGLAISYGIIKQHSGFIDVRPEPGSGTTCRVYIPAIGSG
ncbi:MAG: hypothetical protein HZA17_03670 [Nitrospirae bacterium]|nr:hypothetical protein [Nitrospirota bacterium]